MKKNLATSLLQKIKIVAGILFLSFSSCSKISLCDEYNLSYERQIQSSKKHSESSIQVSSEFLVEIMLEKISIALCDTWKDDTTTLDYTEEWNTEAEIQKLFLVLEGRKKSNINPKSKCYLRLVNRAENSAYLKRLEEKIAFRIYKGKEKKDYQNSRCKLLRLLHYGEYYNIEAYWKNELKRS